MKFTYRSGQRPLDGFTLKRGVGKGGFGEVYFAVSDGGKEVALKLLRGPTEIELRGVANCLNLKHPNLVHVYDLKTDDRGDAWLIMEYVLGESLNQVIGRHPTGLPQNIAKEWFITLARAVGFLHDHGVVHRDLKPANIFVENGTLKVGDYGLCKALGASHRQQTRTVGTVHYMAPEISTGNYNRQIDIYACGVILHEMLTGNVPFDGESDGEILMKHLTAAPDLGKVPSNFRAVVGKALDKNPVRRYATMAEFARAVETVAMTTAVAAPVLASGGREPPVESEQPVGSSQQGADAPRSPQSEPKPIPVATVIAPPLTPPPGVNRPTPLPAAKPAASTAFRDRLADMTGAMLKAPFIVALALIPYALVTQTADWTVLGKLFALTTGATWAMLAGAAGAGYRAADTWGRRARLGVLGLLVGVGAYWLDGWELPKPAAWVANAQPEDLRLMKSIYLRPDAAGAGLHYLLYFGGVFAAGRWWLASAKDRKERFGLFPLIAAGFWAGVLAFLWPWASGSVVAGGVVPLVVSALAVQAASPWVPPPPPVPRKLRWRG